jgi:acyl-CoA synthetase (AMP-forming)/AMP-acid ligase II
MFNIETVPRLFLRFTDTFRKSTAFLVKDQGKWIGVSTDEFALRAEHLFFGLQALGIRPGERVAILSENRVEWPLQVRHRQRARSLFHHPTLARLAALKHSGATTYSCPRTSSWKKLYRVVRACPISNSLPRLIPLAGRNAD